MHQFISMLKTFNIKAQTKSTVCWNHTLFHQLCYTHHCNIL